MSDQEQKTKPDGGASVSTAMLGAWRPIETAPKNGTTVLVWFKPHGAMSVSWTDRDGDPTSEYAHWHVDDHKHGPYPVRGYMESDATHWMPLPEAPNSV